MRSLLWACWLGLDFGPEVLTFRSGYFDFFDLRRPTSWTGRAPSLRLMVFRSAAAAVAAASALCAVDFSFIEFEV